MLFELRFWSAALRAHAENAACLRALEGGGPAAAVVGAAARSLDAATREALTSVVMQYEGETMGRLPSVAEVDAAMAGQRAGAGVLAVHLQDEESGAAHRSAAALRRLRRQLVPPLVRNVHHVLLEAGRKTGEQDLLHLSLYVADLVADARYGLYSNFDAPGLQHLLSQFRASALELLSAGDGVETA
mmetsp:Transcript_34939/g.104179  ORF Transcript_34939/g.104179 Transcript_34939/m.104179 type:complete len:187 (+) Transcript_34939:531-1091(+)